MKKLMIVFLITTILIIFGVSISLAAITEKQGEDVALFAKNFIEIGNSRRDEKGFPLLTYALSGNWRTCIEIRTKGYTEQLYYVKNNGYYIRNGRYLELGDKWCMDCGTTVLYLLKKTLGLELLNSQGEPWHVQDIYNDARRGKNSQYFEMVYSGVAVRNIDYSKLKKGDIIAYITSNGNHGMLYLGDGYIAHANRDMIKSYGDNKISGFQVNKLNHYFLGGTVVRIMRIKDGIIPEDREVNGIITWPDNGETMDLLHLDDPNYVVEQQSNMPEITIEPVVENTTQEIVAETVPEIVFDSNSGDISGNSIEVEIQFLAGNNELIEEAAKEYVDEKMSSEKLLNVLLTCKRPLFYGPYIQVEVARLQNDKVKAIS